MSKEEFYMLYEQLQSKYGKPRRFVRPLSSVADFLPFLEFLYVIRYIPVKFSRYFTVFAIP